MLDAREVAAQQAELIRSGEECAVVEALFDIAGSGPVAARLEESGHRVEDGQLVIKRERYDAWVAKGAQPTPTVKKLLR